MPGALGEYGELRVKSPGVFVEYLGRPEKTADAFDEEGYFKTGDVVEITREYDVPSDVVYSAYKVLGRKGLDVIKTGGYKVSALEVESILLTHDEIVECAVCGVADETYGERVGAVVALTERGRGGGGGGDDAKVVAAATRALVDAMSAPSSGALAIAPEGLRPRTAAGVSAGGS